MILVKSTFNNDYIIFESYHKNIVMQCNFDILKIGGLTTVESSANLNHLQINMQFSILVDGRICTTKTIPKWYIQMGKNNHKVDYATKLSLIFCKI